MNLKDSTCKNRNTVDDSKSIFIFTKSSSMLNKLWKLMFHFTLYTSKALCDKEFTLKTRCVSQSMSSSEYCPLRFWSSIATRPSAPVCERSAPVAVPALTRDPSSAAGGCSGLHLSWRGRQRTRNEAGPGPSFLPSCSSPFLYILLFHILRHPPAPPSDPQCCRKRSSHWGEDSPKPSGCRPWLRLHAGTPAAAGRSRRPVAGFPDVESGTSSIWRCDVRHTKRQPCGFTHTKGTEKRLGPKPAGCTKEFSAMTTNRARLVMFLF